MRLVVDVIKEDKRWRDIAIAKKYISTVVKSTLLDSEKKYPNALGVCLLLSNNQKLHELNKNFRNKDKATNVLSFPDIDYNDSVIVEKILKEDHLHLGDIAFAYETIMNESELQEKTFLNHFTHLLVHSVLHLVGYDHIDSNDAPIMEAVELRTLEKFNIKNPYYI